MNRAAKAGLWLGGTSAGAFLLLLAITQWSDDTTGAADLGTVSPTPALLARGEYLARLGDCAACHSIPGRPPFSGGLRMDLPIGAIYSTNITPDPSYGIGRFTLTDFDRALRYGVSKGRTLYPAMPFASYAITRPDDVAALYAYFRYGVAAASVPSPANEVAFPLSMRFPLTVWRWTFASDPQPYMSPRGRDDPQARGEYFVRGLGHCGECHTPRGVAFQLLAKRPEEGTAFLSGAPIESYVAPSLRSVGPDSLRDWSVSDLAQFLLTGSADRGMAFASMNDVIAHSTQYMTLRDATDAATYLKSLTDEMPDAAPAYRYDAASHTALRLGDASARGAQLYLDNCAACHRSDGQGYAQVFPPLAGNAVVQTADPSGLVTIVLSGSSSVRTSETPAQFSMPAFAWRLSDAEVADVVTFIRGAWGNRAGALTASQVAPIRKRLDDR